HPRLQAGGHHLDAGDLGARALVALGVDLPGRAQHQQARLVDLEPRLGDPLLDVGIAVQIVAEGASLERTVAHQLERELALADGPHAVVDADRKSTRLNSSHVKSSYAVFCLKKKNDKDVRD